MNTKTTIRPQWHLLWLVPMFLFLLAITGGALRPKEVLAANFFSSSDEQATTNLTQRAQLPSDLKFIEVDNRFGFVHITATEKGAFDWTWNLKVKARTDTLAQQAAEAVSFTVKTNDGRVQLTVSLPNTSLFNRTSFRSDLEIRVPKQVAVRCKNGFGETRITGANGELDASSQHGSVAVQDIGGPVRVQTSFASMTVQNVGPATLRNEHGSVEASRLKGDADIKTSFAALRTDGITGNATLKNEHGSIDARNITGAVKAETSFASLKVASTSPSFDCQNEHGSVEIRAGSTALKHLEAETSFGSLTVRLPDDFAPAIHARTSFAQVESDFPLLQTTRGQNPFADVESDKPRIRLQNQHGSIRVLRGTSVAAR